MTRRIVGEEEADVFFADHKEQLQNDFPAAYYICMSQRHNLYKQIDVKAGYLVTAMTEREDLEGWPEAWAGVETQLLVEPRLTSLVQMYER